MEIQEAIIRYARGEATKAEREVVDVWRKADPENEAEFIEISAILDLIHSSRSGAGNSRLTAAEVVRRATEPEADRPTDERDQPSIRTAASEKQSVWGRAGRSRRSLLRAAVLIPVGIGLGLLTANLEWGDPGLTEITTGPDERTTLTMDGATVRIGPHSRLTVLQHGSDAEVYLEGRAFFAVQPNSSRRFSVSTANGRAVALGTRFEVQSDGPSLRVMVVEGKVAVTTPAGRAELRRGEAAESLGGGALLASATDDPYRDLGWMGNALVFQGTSLEDALLEIERRYHVEITLVDVSLRAVPLTVTFTDQPVEQIVLVVCETLRTTCTVRDGTVRVGTS